MTQTQARECIRDEALRAGKEAFAVQKASLANMKDLSKSASPTTPEQEFTGTIDIALPGV